ncbi:MAG TPA: hypothetical protein VMY18_06890 [Acidobacteriota bacterium]|nr:hypothetical protein [Acidobacteriota bacterium]
MKRFQIAYRPSFTNDSVLMLTPNPWLLDGELAAAAERQESDQLRPRNQRIWSEFYPAGRSSDILLGSRFRDVARLDLDL